MPPPHATGRPLLVCVSGKPGSGKSTLARRLADALWLPLLSGDAIRMGLVETAADADPAGWSAPTGGTVVDAFYGLLGHALAAGVSLVADLSFRRGLDEPRLAALQPAARVVNVHCEVPIDLARERFAAREAGERDLLRRAWSRHRPNHRPLGGAEHVAAQMGAGAFDWSVFEPLDLDVPRLVVDTTDGYAPDLDAVAAFCRGARA